jgi:hypothetical protein
MLTVILAPVAFAGEEDIPRTWSKMNARIMGEEDIPRTWGVINSYLPQGKEDIPRTW